MGLDHGQLNIPLSKRGNFHKELDDYLAEQKRSAADKRASAVDAFNKARQLARAGFQQIDSGMLKAEAVKRGMKPAELKSVVRDLCNDHPQRALKVLALFIPKVPVTYNDKLYTVRQVSPEEWQLTLIGKEREKATLNRQQMQIAGLGHVMEGGNG